MGFDGGLSPGISDLHLSSGASQRCLDRMTYSRSVPTLTISKPSWVERRLSSSPRDDPFSSSTCATVNRRDMVNVASAQRKRLAPPSSWESIGESVFSGSQAELLDKYTAEDRYVGSLVGVRYAEAFKCRSPLLVADPEAFAPSRFG